MELVDQKIEIKVVKHPTVFVRVIQTIKRRRININKLVAEDIDACNASINLSFRASNAETESLKKQINGLVDVVMVK